MANQYTPVLDRFFASVSPEPNSGCWLWTGAYQGSKTDHRPIMYYNKRRIISYRVSWMLFRGPINNGLFVCHHCDVSLCVNPDHLFLGTHTDNARDAMKKGRLYFQTHPEEFKRHVRLIQERSPQVCSKIPRADAPIIRERLRNGEAKSKIAREYGVYPDSISQYLARAEARAMAARRDGSHEH